MHTNEWCIRTGVVWCYIQELSNQSVWQTLMKQKCFTTLGFVSVCPYMQDAPNVGKIIHKKFISILVSYLAYKVLNK